MFTIDTNIGYNDDSTVDEYAEDMELEDSDEEEEPSEREQEQEEQQRHRVINKNNFVNNKQMQRINLN